jgi:hypothetical protein
MAIPAREKIVREFSVEKVGREMAALFGHYCGQATRDPRSNQPVSPPPAFRPARAWARPAAAIRVKA